MKKYIKKVSNYSIVGGLGAVLVLGMSGCSDSGSNNNQNEGNSQAFTQANAKEGAFVVIQEVGKDQYQIVDEYPASETRIILKKQDGTEKILTQAEIDELVAKEAQKIDNGTSALTNPSMSDGGGGLSLGETLLASAAGAIIGSYIGSKLFNNSNYQNARQNSYQNRSTYNRSVNSFKKSSTARTGTKSTTTSKTTSTKKSGFFKSSKSSSSSSRSYGS
jgi:hypothetical protein